MDGRYCCKWSASFESELRSNVWIGWLIYIYVYTYLRDSSSRAFAELICELCSLCYFCYYTVKSVAGGESSETTEKTPNINEHLNDSIRYYYIIIISDIFDASNSLRTVAESSRGSRGSSWSLLNSSSSSSSSDDDEDDDDDGKRKGECKQTQTDGSDPAAMHSRSDPFAAAVAEKGFETSKSIENGGVSLLARWVHKHLHIVRKISRHFCGQCLSRCAGRNAATARHLFRSQRTIAKTPTGRQEGRVDAENQRLTEMKPS